MPLLFANPKDRFSCIKVQISVIEFFFILNQKICCGYSKEFSISHVIVGPRFISDLKQKF